VAATVWRREEDDRTGGVVGMGFIGRISEEEGQWAVGLTRPIIICRAPNFGRRYSFFFKIFIKSI
jgi:hypothetical protein